MREPEHVDVVVVGLGVGGEELGGRLAEAGLSVVGVEHTLLGGECPYWGCIPTKIMIRAGNALAEAYRVDQLAGQAQVRPDWAPVAKRIRDEATDSWNDTVAVDRFTAKGARFVRGRATLTGAGRVRVGEQEFQAGRAVVIATGTTPVIPPIEGLAGTPYWTNREAVEAEQLPASMAVLGGGAIGLELAQVYARFGVRVTVLEAADRLLAVEEPESSELAGVALRADRVDTRVGVRAERVSHDGSTFTVTLSAGEPVTADRLLVATGRRARVADLGLETVGLDPKARAVAVDERMRAGEKLWAIGDVTGHGAFTHLAMYDADVAVRDILGQPGPPADYRAVPRVTFTDPEIGAVGMTEQQARDAGLPVRTGFTRLPESSRGFIHKLGNEGFVKLVADSRRGVLVGGTCAGPAGGEMLGALSVAVHGEVPIDRLRDTVFAYPTFHRAIGQALAQLS